MHGFGRNDRELELDRIGFTFSSAALLCRVFADGLIAGGAGLAYWGYRQGHRRVEGAGIGIAIEAALTLGFDIWASSRANDYRDKLGKLEIVTPRMTFAF